MGAGVIVDAAWLKHWGAYEVERHLNFRGQSGEREDEGARNLIKTRRVKHRCSIMCMSMI